MSQVTYEIIRKLFEIYPIILQTVLFLVLWNVFFRWEKGIWIVAGILAVMNICMGLWLENPGVIRYTMSAVIVLGYCFCKYQKHLEKAVFILLLFYNFHALSYLIADSIYQCTVESIFRGLDVLSEEYIFRVYLGMAIGMGILLLSYTLVLLIMTVADRIGLAISAVSSYESGSRYPTYDTLIKLARMFHVSTDYLLGIADKRNIDVTGLDDEDVGLISQLVDKLRK